MSDPTWRETSAVMPGPMAIVISGPRIASTGDITRMVRGGEASPPASSRSNVPGAMGLAFGTKSTAIPKAPKASRDKRGTKEVLCLGFFVDDIRNGKVPSAADIARRAGCHRGTAAKVLKDQVAIGRELAKRDAQQRYRGRSGL